MIRQEIQHIVSSLHPFDSLEKQHIDFTLQWMASGCEIFRIAKPATPPIHLVSYFVPFDQGTHQLLLTDHKKSGLWLPPGGHVEPNEHPTETVKREALEELGIEASFLLPTPLFLTVTQTVGSNPHTDVSFWYILNGKSTDTLFYATEEFNQIRWFSPKTLPFNHSDPHMKRFFDKLIKKWPLP